MKAEEIRKHFETSKRNVVFIFEEDCLARDEIRGFDLGADTEIAEYRGDAFALKYKIRTLPEGRRLVVLVNEPSPLATGQDPGAFPLLGELMANGEYKPQTAGSFMVENAMNVNDKALTGMVSRHLAKMTTAKGSAVFSGQLGTGFTSEKMAQGLMSIRLGSKGMLEWREIFEKLLVCDAEAVRKPAKETNTTFLFKPDFADVLAEVQGKCRWLFGVEGRMPSGGEIGERGFFSAAAERLVYNASTRSFALAAGDPYAALKETDAERLNRIDHFLRWAAELPLERRKKLFEAVEMLSKQVEAAKIVACYGATAEYGFPFRRLATEILRALAADGFGADSEAKAAAAERMARPEVVGDDTAALARAETAMSRFYAKRAKIGTFALNSREDFVEAYTGGWWRLDRDYRMTLEHIASIADDDCRAVLEAAKDQFETDAQATFNEMNLAWTDKLAEAGGTAGMSDVVPQEEFYATQKDQSVKIAVVVSDGLRYEVALEVMDRLNAERGSVTMETGIARLPTETKYTKAALLPHSSIEFQPSEALRLDGDKPTVATTDREKVLQAHCADGLCVAAKELEGKTQNEKRDIFKHKLVYVFHDSIDHTGHSKGATGLDMAKACRNAVDELVRLIKSIQTTWNVNHVWLVADHGFLLCARDIQDGEKILVDDAENAVEKTTRYYFTRRPDTIHGIFKAALPNGWFIAVPAGTRRFKASGSYTYVHGGASLQEMVIPMMHSRLLGTDASRNRPKVGVSILGADLRVQSSRLKFELLQNEAVSEKVQERTVRCALYADSGVVSDEVEVKLDSTGDSNRVRTVELALNGNAPGILTLKVFPAGDNLNPLAEKTVTNNTLIEKDEW